MALKYTFCRPITSVLVALVFLGGTISAHAQEKTVLQEQTEDFFSDQSRVGSIVGGILAGAAFANPFAPLGGTIIGFIVGKSTDFSEQADSVPNYYARRSFAPAADDSSGIASGQTQTLALSVSTPDSGTAVAGGAAGGAAGLALASDDSNGNTGNGDVSGDEMAGNAETIASADDLESTRAGEDSQPLEPTEAAAPKRTMRPAPSQNLIISKDVGGRQAQLDRLAATIREERNSTPFELNQQCSNQEASRIRKKVVVAGFNVESPDETVFGGLGSVGYGASEWLYQNLLDTGEVLPLSAPTRQMFASLLAGPTREMAGNRLAQYSAVSRQMGAQFVVSGVIRNLNVNRAESWDSSYAASIKRSLFSADTERQFVVDVVLHDGYTGRVVTEQRYTASGRWDIPRTGKVSFGSPEFNDSDYGTAVATMFDDMTDDLMSVIDCQALLVPILEVDGKDLLLDIGTKSGLLPGDKLRVVRAQSSMQRRHAPPKLWDTGVDLHLHQLSLDTSRAWMPADGESINIREGDYAVMY